MSEVKESKFSAKKENNTISGLLEELERAAEQIKKVGETDKLIAILDKLTPLLRADRKNFKKEDGEKAEKIFRLAEESDVAIAKNFLLAWCYKQGFGVEKNYQEAARLYRLTAEQGYAAAQNSLAFCYRNGEGVEKDLTAAVRLYRLAADQDYAAAQNNLAFCYRNGEGIEKDLTEAVRLYRLVADKGYAAAQNELAICYYRGDGIGKDLTEAVRLFRLAADQGHAAAQSNLAVLYENGNGVGKNLEEALRLYRLAAAKGNLYATAKLHIIQREDNKLFKKIEEEQQNLARLVVKKSLSQEDNKEKIGKEIEKLLIESPNKLPDGYFEKGPNKELAKKLTLAEKKLMESGALECFQNFFPAVLINGIMDYATFDIPEETMFNKIKSSVVSFFSPRKPVGPPEEKKSTPPEVKTDCSTPQDDDTNRSSSDVYNQ